MTRSYCLSGRGSGAGTRNADPFTAECEEISPWAKRLVTIVVGKGDTDLYRRRQSASVLKAILSSSGRSPGIEKFYAAADIFVCQLFMTLSANACLEAMASGLPVVTTRKTALQKLSKEGKEGFVTASITGFFGAGRRDCHGLCERPSHRDEGRGQKRKQLSIEKSAICLHWALYDVSARKEAR